MKRLKISLAAIILTLIITSLSYAQGYECGECHPAGEPIHNCLAIGCHDTYERGNHHTTGWASAGMCVQCHDSNIVANFSEENPLSYPATMVTPKVENCTVCHKGRPNPLDENGIPYPHPIYETLDLEHMYPDFQGYVTYCTLCHSDPPTWDPDDPYLIRYCETCHSPETLHAISGHIEGGYWYDENGNWTEITANQRCNACHNGPDVIPMLYVQQAVGTFDTKFSELTEYDCRVCHGVSTAAIHHAETLINCSYPPSTPTITTNACEGMSPVVGTRLAHMTLTGTDFGYNGQLSVCGDYEVQMQEGVTWIDVPATAWTDTFIDWTLPPWTFTPNAYHNVRVETPTGISNERQFYLLASPVVDRIEDDTGGDNIGPLGGWLTVYSPLYESGGIFTDAREKWYEDTLGGICPNFFGSIYVVTFTSENDRFCATIYDEWNATGNKDSFKVKLQDLWIDSDGDYFKDDNEQLCGPGRGCAIPIAPYSVQACLILYADSNSNGSFSGNEDTVYHIVKSKSDIIYNINTILIRPNGGEVIPSGSGYNIQWEASPEAVKFTLTYSKDNGTTWNLIAKDITVTSYDWQVPTLLNNKKQCLVKVKAFNSEGVMIGKDKSDSVFTIEVVKLTSPDGGETLTSGTTHTITWTTNATKNPVASVKLVYSTNGGTTWTLIDTPSGNPGSYDWTVPNVSSSSCKVKVVLKDSSGTVVGKDTSDGFFEIQ